MLTDLETVIKGKTTRKSKKLLLGVPFRPAFP